MPELRCRHRLPSPEVAGYTTLEKLKEIARQYPHLRPCPLHKGDRGSWHWIERTRCEGCPEAVEA